MTNSEFSQDAEPLKDLFTLPCVKCSLHFSFVREGWEILVIGAGKEKSLPKSRITNKAPFSAGLLSNS